MMANHTTFFKPWETIFESNPQQMLERKEQVSLGPLLIMQGGLDDNVLPSVQEKFAAPTEARAASATITSSKAPSTSGLPKRARTPTARATWSRRSSPATRSQRAVLAGIPLAIGSGRSWTGGPAGSPVIPPVRNLVRVPASARTRTACRAAPGAGSRRRRRGWSARGSSLGVRRSRLAQHGIVEVRAVGDVEDVEEDLERRALRPCGRRQPARTIDLEDSRARVAPLRLPLNSTFVQRVQAPCRYRCRPARIVELAVPVRRRRCCCRS